MKGPAVSDVIKKINGRLEVETKSRKETERLRKKLLFEGLTLGPYFFVACAVCGCRSTLPLGLLICTIFQFSSSSSLLLPRQL
jgi:hypothetical protein